MNNKKVSFHTVSDPPNLIFLFAAIIISVLIFILQGHDFDQALKKREEQLLRDYPEIVSKLLLLHNAGLTLQNSFASILNDAKKSGEQNHYIFLEVERMLNRLKSGMPESGAYAELGRRCNLHAYIKLGSILEQNRKKGSSDLSCALQSEVQEAFSDYKRNALRAGETAGTKMLIPMMLIFLVVMLIIIIPAFLSMNAGQ